MRKNKESPLTNRLSVDIGGTFTDLVLETSEAMYSRKVLTTSNSPEEAIFLGMREVCDDAKIQIQNISEITHGTTLATNALIERNGARTALITTHGFRDVIEMRTESRFEQYDLNLVIPHPLISRQHRYTVLERVTADGKIVIDLEKKQAVALAKKLKQAKYESIAIGLIHSYANNKHEKILRDIFKTEIPNIPISLSSEVSPQMREYERFNTVTANAYIKPMIKNYLIKLKKRLRSNNVLCPIFLIHSGGGIISLKKAAEFPVRLVESGPAGGAVFASVIAQKYNLNNVLSFDMGGTTAKICLIKNQSPKTNRVFEVARSYRFKKGSGMPVSIPVIEMVEIGAGGGSIANLDDMKQIRVGPRSAGASPGPACYAKGGIEPSVTDADLILKKLDSNNFAGGSIQLNLQAAEEAVEKNIGQPLRLSTLKAAFGISEVVDENMANAARVHAVENGEDLSQYVMIAFGGAAPLHAARLCDKLGIKKFFVPSNAGVGSALGFLHAPFSFEASRTNYMNLRNFNSSRVRTIFQKLESKAFSFVKTCKRPGQIKSVFKAYMRYRGQGWEIPVELSSTVIQDLSANQIKQIFEKEYGKLFGRSVDGIDIEITSWSVNAFIPQKPVSSARVQNSKKVYSVTAHKKFFDQTLGKSVNAKIVERSKLAPGESISGPAIIMEKDTSVLLSSNFKAVLQNDGCISVNKFNIKGDL